ncbi:cytochrome c peroxidase [Beggiatoa sp. PS]|nr:cytochrome c peroxidase [Beggiatoa sp. PS]
MIRACQPTTLFSCGTCHQPAKGFADGLVTPEGSTGEVHPRNSMGLTNAAYNSILTWANPNLKTLFSQALVPMLGESPVELGWSGHEEEILDRFRYDAVYSDLFEQAFPTDSITEMTVAKAIAAFCQNPHFGQFANR